MQITVLLVDDEKDFIEMLSERLVARGLSVLTAQDGAEALIQVRENNPDVVVLDVLMPGKSGIEVLQKIKQERPLTEVILLTGHGTVEAAVAGMRAGAYDYILKPAEMKELVGKIISAYKRRAEQEERIRSAEIQQIMLTRGWD
jgi:DNA-binding NtrC family response regulator